MQLAEGAVPECGNRECLRATGVPRPDQHHENGRVLLGGKFKLRILAAQFAPEKPWQIFIKYQNMHR
jgi:hypothetical protein